MPRTYLLLTLSVVACQDMPETARDVRPIVGGVADTGDGAVPAIILFDGSTTVGLCSGTLISPRVVMTAAHCVAPDSGADGWLVYFGSTVTEASDPHYIGQADVLAHTVHPSWNPATLANDIALLQIEGTGPVSPIPINRNPPAFGATVRLVGFGDTSGGAGDGGSKRQANSSIGDVDSTLIWYGSSSTNTCQGDSGGPNFITVGGEERVAGVTSFGDPGCDEYGGGTRVDAYQTFIDSWVEDHDMILCTEDGGCASGCGAIDPDCPCAADGFCTTSCTVIDGDADCPQGCRPNGVCVEGCPFPDQDCNPTQQCGADANCNAECVSDPDCGLAPVGGRCRDNAECLSGLCIGGQDSTFCTASCDVAASDCPEGMACTVFGDGNGYCTWPGPSPGSTGYPCTYAEDCFSGLCLATSADTAICTEYCSDADPCAEGWECLASDSGDICSPAEPPPPPPEGDGDDEDDGDDDEGGCRSSVSGARRANAWPLLVVLFVFATLLRATRRRPSTRGW